MEKIVLVLSSIIAYGIYCQAANKADIFTLFWSLVEKFLGG